MAVTASDVLAAAGAGSADTAIATRVLAEANVHVSEFIDENLISASSPVPAVAEDAAVLRCATDLFLDAKSPMGRQVLSDGSGGVVVDRIAADPLARVRPVLARWCGPDLGIA